MSALAKSIDALYFEYKSVAGHLEGCRFRGTDVWEVTRHTWLSITGDDSEVTIRLACYECGVVHFEGPADGLGSMETTHADQIGYAGKPERVAGVWLHPGPRIWHGDERGPSRFLVTASKDRPQRPDYVLGVVGWHLGSRGGVRWGAGIGCTGHGTVRVSSAESGAGYFASRRAAVTWLTEHAGSAR